MHRRNGWLEGVHDPCAPGTPVTWLPVRDLTPAETHRLNEAVWRMEHHRYNRNTWAQMNGAASYQGRGV